MRPSRCALQVPNRATIRAAILEEARRRGMDVSRLEEGHPHGGERGAVQALLSRAVARFCGVHIGATPFAVAQKMALRWLSSMAHTWTSAVLVWYCLEAGAWCKPAVGTKAQQCLQCKGKPHNFFFA